MNDDVLVHFESSYQRKDFWTSSRGTSGRGTRLLPPEGFLPVPRPLVSCAVETGAPSRARRSPAPDLGRRPFSGECGQQAQPLGGLCAFVGAAEDDAGTGGVGQAHHLLVQPHDADLGMAVLAL